MVIVIKSVRVLIDIYRRAVDIHERQFLQDSKAVTEMQCDLGKYAMCMGYVLCQWPDLT